MEKNIQLQKSVLQNVISLLDNDTALMKLNNFIITLKKDYTEKKTDTHMNEELEDLRQSLIELKMVKQGKLKSKPIKELLYVL